MPSEMSEKVREAEGDHAVHERGDQRSSEKIAEGPRGRDEIHNLTGVSIPSRSRSDVERSFSSAMRKGVASEES